MSGPIKINRDSVKTDSIQPIKVNVSSEGGVIKDGVKYVSRDAWFNTPNKIQDAAKAIVANLKQTYPNVNIMVAVANVDGGYKFTIKGIAGKNTDGLIAILHNYAIKATADQKGIFVILTINASKPV